MTEALTHAWAFGGPLARVSPATAWTILGLIAGLGAWFIWVSYGRTVRPLRVGYRVMLPLIRASLLGTLLLCLANPVRLERQTRELPESPSSTRPRLAVMVDRSDSMTLPDNRGRSRLDDALDNWRRLEPAARKHFAPADYYSVAEDLRPAKTLEEAKTQTGGTSDTRLYRAVASLLQEPSERRPEAVVVLTDGVDTSTDPETVLRDAAIETGVSVYFVAGSNRSARPEPYLRVREWRVPPTAWRNSEFTIEATLEAYSRSERTVAFTVWQGGRRLMRGEVALTAGANVITQSFTVSASEPGPVEFALRIGPGDTAPFAARAVTAVLSPNAHKIRVLVYQNALDWGLRYFLNGLRTDPTFEVSTIIAPDVGVKIAGGAMARELPHDAKSLARFDCIVIVRVEPKRLTSAQQTALVEFVRGGGSILFLSVDSKSLPQFSESVLRGLLPVELPTTMPTPVPTVTSEPLPPPRGMVLNRIAKSRVTTPAAPPKPLVAFALTDAGRTSPIFNHAQATSGTLLVPRFWEYIPFEQAKPAAEVLAVSPHDNARPHILFATQTFGGGRTALLATDTLWRWRLSESSESRAVETFWQQMLLAIGRPREVSSLRFVEVPTRLNLGQSVTLRLDSPVSDKAPTAIAKSPDGRETPLVVRSSDDSEKTWAVELTPDRAGIWEVSAQQENVQPTNTFPTVVEEPAGELAPNVPALDTLRALAAETGGALLTREPPVTWREETDLETLPASVSSDRTTFDWNRWIVLGFALGCCGLELVLRRKMKLL